jgi:peptidoglycan/xylan/chitin deacetylase (PgdA/CDA1 family)
VRRVFTLSRRRLVLGVVCAGLVALPALGGFTAGRSLRTSAAPAPGAALASGAASASGAALAPGGDPFASSDPFVSPTPFVNSAPFAGAAPASSAVEPAVESPPSPVSPDPSSSATGVATLPPGMDPPVGWKLSDIPRFPPAPAPEPITLPEGDEVPFLSQIPVTRPVAFLTIDDGFLKNPEGPKLLAAAGIPVTLFLTTDAIHDNVPYFDNLRTYGAVIESHTISHPELRGRGYAFQRHQICDGTDRLQQWYGRRPLLFRPPFGDKDHTTLRVAKECGLRAAFMWRETVDKGILRYQGAKQIQPGDIILMHFRPAFIKDFIAALRAIHRAGLTPALLEDYVPTEPPTGPSAPPEPGSHRSLGDQD